MTELSQLLQAAILGLMQGLAEFLPISSSAHLIIIPQILGWPYLGKSFDVALHFGTLLALLVMFRVDVARMLRGFGHIVFPQRRADLEETRLAKLILIGCLPAGLVGLIFEDFIEETLGGLFVVAAALIAWGLLLEMADRDKHSSGRTMADFTYRDAFLIGWAQAAALIPGTSRSGATITAALFLGFSRTEAARFSFLLSIPLVAGAAFLKGITLAAQAPPMDILGPVLVGILVSALSGFFCIKYFLRYLKQNSFRPFVIYRFCLGLFLVWWALTTG